MKVYAEPLDTPVAHGGYIPSCDECGQKFDGPVADAEGDICYNLLFCLPCMKRAVKQMEALAQKKG